MDKTVVEYLLHDRLDRYRRLSYDALRQLVGTVQTEEIQGPTGACYQLDVQFLWDEHPNGDVRVLGSIDDGGLRAFVPLTESFIKAPSGEFVGE